MTRYVRRGTAEVVRIKVLKVRLAHGDRNCDGQTGIVDEGHDEIVTLAVDYVLVSAFVHPGHIAVSVLGEVFDGVVGNTVGPERFVEIIKRFLLALASLVPLEAGTAAATPDDGPHKGDAPVNPVEGHLQVFVGLVDRRYFVGAEGAQQQCQEQIQHLRDDEIIASDERTSNKKQQQL